MYLLFTQYSLTVRRSKFAGSASCIINIVPTYILVLWLRFIKFLLFLRKLTLANRVRYINVCIIENYHIRKQWFLTCNIQEPNQRFFQTNLGKCDLLLWLLSITELVKLGPDHRLKIMVLDTLFVVIFIIPFCCYLEPILVTKCDV